MSALAVNNGATSVASSAASKADHSVAHVSSPMTDEVAGSGTAAVGKGLFNDALRCALGDDETPHDDDRGDEVLADDGLPLALPCMLAVLMTTPADGEVAIPNSAKSASPDAGDAASDEPAPLLAVSPSVFTVAPAASGVAIPQVVGESAANDPVLVDSTPPRSGGASAAPQDAPDVRPPMMPDAGERVVLASAARTGGATTKAPLAQGSAVHTGTLNGAASAVNSVVADNKDANAGTALPALSVGPLQPLAGATSTEPPLTLPNGQATQWRSPLLQALAERVQVTSANGGENAVIGLDPPQMGHIEITIRHQADFLQVTLSATHNEVLRQLQGIGENLRHDLAQRHSGDVSVQVAEASPSRFAQGESERQRQRQPQALEQEPGRALAEAHERLDSPHFQLALNQELTT